MTQARARLPVRFGRKKERRTELPRHAVPAGVTAVCFLHQERRDTAAFMGLPSASTQPCLPSVDPPHLAFIMKVGRTWGRGVRWACLVTEETSFLQVLYKVCSENPDDPSWP